MCLLQQVSTSRLTPERNRFHPKMFIKLGAVLLLISVSVGHEEDHKWDLAVAIKDQVELLNSNGSLIGTTNDPVSFSSLKALTFDSIRHQFFVSDMEQANDSIFAIPLQKEYGNSSSAPIVADLPDDVQGLAIDPVEDVLYWTDSINRTINYVFLSDPLKQMRIFKTFKDEEPQDLVIDSCRRYIYWTNSNVDRPTIERATLDGENHEVLIDSDLFRPGGIALDHVSGRIYWTDIGQGIYYRIESTNLDGKERQVIYAGTYQKPVGIAVDEEAIYWTDVNNNALWRIRKKFVEEPFRLREFKEKPMGIVAKNMRFSGSPDCEKYLSAASEYNESTTEYFLDVIDDEGYPAICLNGGELLEDACVCHRGFTGTHCEISLCFNYCLHGTCAPSQRGYPVCNCHPRYSGKRCDRDSCDGFCLNDGTCKYNTTSKWGASCTCPEGYSGQRCEISNNITYLCLNYCRTYKDEHERDPSACRCDVQSTSSPASNNSIFKADEIQNAPQHLTVPAYFRDSTFLILMVCMALLLLSNIVLGVLVCKLRRRRRPRINKRIIINKNVTPLTYRPQPDTEQCEITIENCCNMNVCETPCFDPPQLRKVQKKDEKKTLIANMENGDDLY